MAMTKRFKKLPKAAKRAAFAAMDDSGNKNFQVYKKINDPRTDMKLMHVTSVGAKSLKSAIEKAHDKRTNGNDATKYLVTSRVRKGK